MGCSLQCTNFERQEEKKGVLRNFEMTAGSLWLEEGGVVVTGGA